MILVTSNKPTNLQAEQLGYYWNVAKAERCKRTLRRKAPSLISRPFQKLQALSEASTVLLLPGHASKGCGDSLTRAKFLALEHSFTHFYAR